MTATLHSNAAEKPVWLITGCSTGFGRELAKYVLSRGYRTVVTARDIADLSEFAGNPNALLATLDVTKPHDIAAAITLTMGRFKQVDVLVNNAGIGYFAAVEESEDDQVRRMFEINVFGLAGMIDGVLPGMRLRRFGAIINISSLAGLRGSPSIGYYNATKFAVEGLSESLSEEVKPLGIKVMLVEPGPFRTDWAGRSAAESEHQIADYAATAGAWRTHVRAISGKQKGDPVRAAHAIVEAIESARPPHHLLLGNEAYESAISLLDELRQEFTAWEAVSRGADFPSTGADPVVKNRVTS